MPVFADRRVRRVILYPRDHLAYGQDFHSAGLVEHCALTILRRPEDSASYRWSGADPELIITQNPNDSGDADFAAGMGRKVPIVAHMHCRWDYFDDDEKELVSRTLDNVAAAITPAEFHRREMQSLFPHVSWHVGANGVRPDLFRPANKRERDEFKLAHLLPPDTKLVGFTGRIELAKGVQILKEIGRLIADEPFALLIQFPAWQAIHESRPKMWERSKSLLQEIRDLCPRKVILWPDTAPRFNDRPVRFLDVFLFPSLSEVQPLVVLEALASGVPVVATDSTPFYQELRALFPDELQSALRVEPLPPWLKQGSTRRKTELKDEEAVELAQALVKLIRDIQIPEYRQRELLASAILEAGFSEASMNARINSIYDQVIQGFPAQKRGVTAGKIFALTQVYVDLAPTEPGNIEFFVGGAVIRVKDAAVGDGIRAALEEALTATDGKERPTHFRFEVSRDPMKRLRRHAEFVAKHGLEERRKRS
jgi:1,2-diacylglycerol-3-alpha-glucose alpha-1,2-glucosyltransferase